MSDAIEVRPDSEIQPARAPQSSDVACPYCAETIQAAAKKCRHCGEILDPQLRDIASVKAGQGQQVFMNAGGNAPQQLRPWGHGLHIVLSILTLGAWIPIWLILYLARNRSIYF